MNLHEIELHPITPSEEPQFRALLDAHHYLGSLPKIGNTLWYVVTWHDQWIALVSFSAAAWKCAAQDQWIGWGFRYQFDRLHLVANKASASSETARQLLLRWCGKRSLLFLFG